MHCRENVLPPSKFSRELFFFSVCLFALIRKECVVKLIITDHY